MLRDRKLADSRRDDGVFFIARKDCGDRLASAFALPSEKIEGLIFVGEAPLFPLPQFFVGEG